MTKLTLKCVGRAAIGRRRHGQRAGLVWDNDDNDDNDAFSHTQVTQGARTSHLSK